MVDDPQTWGPVDMSPTTFLPSTIYIEIDVSGLSLIDAERFFNIMAARFPLPAGCKARGKLDLEEVEE